MTHLTIATWNVQLRVMRPILSAVTVIYSGLLTLTGLRLSPHRLSLRCWQSSDQAPRPKGGASSGQVGLADYRLLRDTCPSSEEDASIGGTAPKPCKNQDLSWGNLSPKPPNEDDIPPRPEDGASCHGLVKPGQRCQLKSIIN